MKSLFDKTNILTKHFWSNTHLLKPRQSSTGFLLCFWESALDIGASRLPCTESEVGNLKEHLRGIQTYSYFPKVSDFLTEGNISLPQ